MRYVDGLVQYFRHEYGVGNFIRPDGNTPANRVDVVIDGVVVESYVVGTNATDESDAVRRAIARLAQVDVPELSEAPVVTITGDTNIEPGTGYSFNANVTDADSTVFTYSWSLLSGAGYPLNSELGTDATFSNTGGHGALGTRVFQVVVTDDQGNSTTATHTLVIAEAAPSGETVTTSDGTQSSTDRKIGGEEGTWRTASTSTHVDTVANGTTAGFVFEAELFGMMALHLLKVQLLELTLVTNTFY